MHFELAGSSVAGLQAFLASVQSSASMEGLHFSCWLMLSKDPTSIALTPTSGALTSLPHVRCLEVSLRTDVPFQLALPMPGLESLTVRQQRSDRDYWDAPAEVPLLGRSQAAAGQAAALLFLALRHVRAQTQRLVLRAPDLPALESLSLELFSPPSNLFWGAVIVEPRGAAQLALTSMASGVAAVAAPVSLPSADVAVSAANVDAAPVVWQPCRLRKQRLA